MIDCSDFFEALKNRNLAFFTGVPDSLLKDICACISDNTGPGNNIIAANEGNAVALAAGYHLATGEIGTVYMQNSGQGNAVNPLTSLADPDVYGIPMLMIIAWRGEPGGKDEPQHLKQGKITLEMLDTLNIPYSVLPEDTMGSGKVLDRAVGYMGDKKAPYALIVRKGIFGPYVTRDVDMPTGGLMKEEALKLVVGSVGERDVIVSTTGTTSRELFEHRKEIKEGQGRDFLTVGSMGHASSIALGIALRKKERDIYCLDGDGAAIMHMGALAVIGDQCPQNFRHIIFNNGAHDSVGGQPTAGFRIDFPAIAMACGYKAAFKAENAEEIVEKMSLLREIDGPALLEIRVRKGSRKDLGRPSVSPVEGKKAFMDFLFEKDKDRQSPEG